MKKLKRILCFWLIAILLVGTAPVVMAAGSTDISGPKDVRGGDTVTVSFSAGGGILGGSGTLEYDPSVLTLQSCDAVIADSWVVIFNGDNFMFYDDSLSAPVEDAVIFTATFLVAESVTKGTRISVSAKNVVLSDGQKDMPQETVTYEVMALALIDAEAQPEKETNAFNQFVATVLSLPVLGGVALGCVLICVAVGVTEKMPDKKKKA